MHLPRTAQPASLPWSLRANVVDRPGDRALASAMDGFLAGVERRALRMAELAVNDPDDALDLVQDAMFMLARRYADRPEEEWSPLFWRILQNRITDLHRRRQIRRRLLGWLTPRADEEARAAVPEAAAARAWEPEAMLDRSSLAGQMLAAIRQLPLRQQQAFLLRQWEGLSVADTAAAMKCSAGSVKTHHSRAVAALRQQLGEHADEQG